MKQIKSQAGMTLIEILATITILSIVSVILYSVFSNGLRYSSQAEDTVLIQQEANYLLTTLKKQHENADSYTITVDQNHQKVTIETTVGTSVESSVIESEEYQYQISDTENNIDAASEPIEIIPSNENFHIQIVVTNKIKPDLTYKIKTILSRL